MKALIILTLFLQSHAQYDLNRNAFNRSMLNTIQEVSQEIASVKTTNNAVFIGLGRSPAPMMAALENASESVVNLPFSDGSVWESKIRSAGSIKTELELYNSLKPHFEKFLKQSLTNSKEIILVDYGASGKTYSLGYRLLNRYIHENCSSCTLKGVVLTDNTEFIDLRLEGAVQKSRNLENVKIIDLSKKGSYQNLANSLAKGDYKLIAEYGSYSIEESTRLPLERNKDYDVFKAWIKNKTLSNSQCVSCMKKSALEIQPKISPITNTLGMFTAFSMFLPFENPYQQQVGLNCKQSREAINKMRCAWDSKFNPFNNQLVCTKIVSVNTLSTNGSESSCSANTQIVSFECSSLCKDQMKNNSLLTKDGQTQNTDEKTKQWLNQIQSKYSVKPENFMKTFPEAEIGFN